ncbi:patatin-like phospholipase family protein [Desulfonatronum thioautotrophicum]|uniref:patatin-like phospholipase family protein n=1 Tax=Desulfonatronum thioautotrophicum TaxID=617001 RepID=UPI00129478A1|nr:patatin-like phospholipase family protein [Desulfonatronum thioautotrophicum]
MTIQPSESCDPPVFSRRSFLAGSATSSIVPFLTLAAGTSSASSDKRPGERNAAARTDGKRPSLGQTLGLALGSGGTNGLAHIPMLEVLDELGIVPRMIAGSSIGAVIGALYASGLTGAELRRLMTDFSSEDEHILYSLVQGSAGLSLFDLLRPDFDDGGLLDSQGFLDFLHDKIRVSSFEELAIPLKIVAADYWKREQVVLDQGPLIPAVKASMAVPGLFAPVSLNGRLLVDGGTVNPLSFDLLQGKCDLIVAVDVSGDTAEKEESKPDASDSLFNTFEIMQRAIVREKMKHTQSDILLHPKTSGVRLLHFHKAEQIFTQSAPTADEFRSALRELLD